MRVFPYKYVDGGADGGWPAATTFTIRGQLPADRRAGSCDGVMGHRYDERTRGGWESNSTTRSDDGHFYSSRITT